MACGIRQEHSNIQSGIIYERLIHGVPQILLYKTTRVWRDPPLLNLSLLYTCDTMDRIRVALRGEAGSDLEIILHSRGICFEKFQRVV